MKPGILAGIVVAALIAVGAFIFIGSEDSTETSNSANTTTQADTSQNELENDSSQEGEAVKESDSDTTEEAITAADVAGHSTGSDCWTIVEGAVYDITAYVPRHPGGDEILRACGTDGTSLFTQRTTSDGETVGTGNPHSSRATDQLSDFKIGDLAQ